MIKYILIPVFFLLFACSCTDEKQDQSNRALAAKRARAATDSILANARAQPTLLDLILTNDAVTEAVITSSNVLVVAVKDNGQDKAPMAELYCRMARENGDKIGMVKILDAMDAEFNVGPEGSPYGTTLATSFCP